MRCESGASDVSDSLFSKFSSSVHFLLFLQYIYTFFPFKLILFFQNLGWQHCKTLLSRRDLLSRCDVIQCLYCNALWVNNHRSDRYFQNQCKEDNLDIWQF